MRYLLLLLLLSMSLLQCLKRTESCTLHFGHEVANKPFQKTRQALTVLTVKMILRSEKPEISFYVFINIFFMPART